MCQTHLFSHVLLIKPLSDSAKSVMVPCFGLPKPKNKIFLRQHLRSGHFFFALNIKTACSCTDRYVQMGSSWLAHYIILGYSVLHLCYHVQPKKCGKGFEISRTTSGKYPRLGSEFAELG